ncbi:MAG: FAD-binding oxidoreductase [Promethearchaeota archaeon]|jgi:alkyldihydroxyacetonephosphate synthase
MDLKEFEVVYSKDRKEIKDKSKVESKLKEIVGVDNVSSKNIDLLAYSKDSTLISMNWTIEGKLAALPDFITWPENIQQISNILKFANKEGIPVIPFAEGSGVVGGAIPINGGIIVDMKKHSKILQINDKNLTVTAEAGINGMILERYLNAKGYTSGHIPQSLYTSSLGGWIAHRAAGQFSTKYGKIEDIILGMELVLPQGEIINFKTIARASTGPQFDKLFIGGEGTLGIVTKATLKIWPLPEKRILISYAFPTIENSFDAVRNILRENVYPAVIRIYDQFETARHFPDIEKAKDKVMAIFVCEGNSELADLEGKITREKSELNSGIDCGEHPAEHWLETRFRVTETSSMPPYKIVFDTVEVASLWDNAAEVYHTVLESMNQLNGLLMVTAHVSHFYPNGVGIYFSFGGVPTKGMSDLKFYQECWDTTIKAVLEAGGSIAHHHGVGINRSHWMDEEWGTTMKTLRMIKKLIDPNNILNPGKLYVDTWKGGED